MSKNAFFKSIAMTKFNVIFLKNHAEKRFEGVKCLKIWWQSMSDISEHDSDSDTETTKLSKLPQATAEGNNAGPNGSSDVVAELKQQAAVAEQNDERPDWEKYLQQSRETGAYTYTDPNDGTIYEWDAEKRGWIPKIDDDFIAMYQANYGFTAEGVHDPNVNAEPEPEPKPELDATQKGAEMKRAEEEKAEAGKKRKQEQEQWFDIDPKTNNNVYVTGLPLSTTEEEFIELMSKYGIIMLDDRGKQKVKMYHTPEGQFKGDARCCYLKRESVVLTCDLLDETEFNGSKLHVEQAVFHLKGTYDPSKKPKKKKVKKKKAYTQEKLLDWVDRPKKRSKFDRIVILKNVFDPKEFEKDPALINEVKGDMRSEAEKFGEVKKILVFDRSPLGVISVLFHEPEDADKCIEALNGRYYAKRIISAETFDGKTNYQVEETEEELTKRLNEWENFIGDDDKEEHTESAEGS